MPARPDVSIVIPTRDSAVELRRCLASLKDQRASFETLVVDQQSADGTREVADAAGAVTLETERPALYAPPTRSRNMGAAVARGEYLLHLDADMALTAGVLDRAVSACREGAHVALILEEVDFADGFWAECKALERRTYRASGVLEGARFVQTDVFRAVGGYDEGLGSGEDWDIHASYLARGSIGRLTKALYHYVGHVSFAAQTRKKFTYGRTARAFLGKHGGSRFSQAMLTSYARSWRLFAADPIHSMGFVVLRSTEVVALSLGIAVAAATRRVPPSRNTASSEPDRRAHP